MIDEKEIKEFNEMSKLLAYSKHGDVQNLVTMYHWLEKHDKTMNDVERFVKARPRLMQFSKEGLAEALRVRESQCIKCQLPMDAYRVNSTPRNQIGGDYKFQYICPNCQEEMFV